MSKEYFLDYATHAFVRYAKYGCPTREEYECRIRKEVLQKYSVISPEKAALKAEAAIKAKEGRLMDIDAVNKVFDTLERKGKHEIAAAIRAVYFVNPQGKPRRGTITARARRFAIECPANERTVYKWLKSARRLFAIYRNLDMDDRDETW